MFYLKIPVFLSCFVATLGWAKPTYEKTENCATAKVVSGDTCSNVKVRFDFKSCPGNHESQTVGWYQCSGQNLTARATVPGYRFQAKFKKQDDGWGSVNWEGPTRFTAWKHAAELEKQSVAQEIKSKPMPPVSAAPPATPVTSAKTPETAAPRTPAAEEKIFGAFKVSSFLDFRYKNTTIDRIPQKNESGFLFEDSALYVEYKKDQLTFFVDLPFARGAATPDNADFDFAKLKAQAYATYAMNDSFALTFGQFDTIYGIELNDSKDRVFGQTGLVYSQTLPIVHSGALLQYTHGDVVGKLMVANPSDRSTLGSAASTGDDYHEFGATLGYNWELLHGQVGYLTRSMRDLSDKSAQRNFLDVIVGTKYGPFTLDVEYGIVTNPRKNTLTTDGTDKEDAGTALMALATYSPLEKWLLGLRYENLNKDPGGNGYNKVSTFGATVHHDLTENLQARVEYYSIDVPTDVLNTKKSEERFYVGGLLHF